MRRMSEPCGGGLLCLSILLATSPALAQDAPELVAFSSVFDELRLWTDVNHNGVSEAAELARSGVGMSSPSASTSNAASRSMSMATSWRC